MSTIQVPKRKPIKVPVDAPAVTPRPKQSAVVDTRYVPKTRLLAHVEGAPWTVHYYKQMLGLTDEGRPLDPGSNAAHQQYHRILNFELRVTQPIDPSQDSNTMEFEVTGSANVYNDLKPNKGDMFVADVADGRAGLFAVTEVKRLAYTKEAIHSIDYQLTRYVTADIEEELERKSIQRTVFHKEFIELEENPFVTEDDSLVYHNLYEIRRQLEDLFMDRYWAVDVNNLMVPEQEGNTYDHGHASYCRFIGLGDIRCPITLYTHGEGKAVLATSLWDILKDSSNISWSRMHRHFKPVTVRNFNTMTAIARTIIYSRYDLTVYPWGDFYKSDRSIRQFGTVPWKVKTPYSISTFTLDGREVPLLHPVHKDDCYVLSAAFYDRTPENQSLLEHCLILMLSGHHVQPLHVKLIATAIMTAPPLEQFYYIPIISSLIFYTVRG